MKLRNLGVLVSGVLVVPAAIGLASASAAPSPALTEQVSIFSGNAYGTFATVGRTAIAGKSASVALCTSKAGVDKGSNVASVDITDLATTGAAQTSVSSSQTQSGPSSNATAVVEDVNVLAGLISATSVTADSTTSYDGSAFDLNGSSTLTDLVIAGNQIDANPAPNTKVRLAGIGRVVLNEQTSDVGDNNASLTVNALHLYVTRDVGGLLKGTQLIVSHATSGLGVNRAGSLDGFAYGTTVFDDGGISSGPTARVSIGCAGTDGKLKVNTAAGVDITGVISTGTIRNTARGTITADTATSATTSRVEQVNLIAGLVTADAIRANATATKSGDKISLSGGGSSFTKLVVNGEPISGHVAPNTRIDIGNITVWLHRVIKRANSIEVRQVEVIVRGVEPKGPADALHVQVAVAHASAH